MPDERGDVGAQVLEYMDGEVASNERFWLLIEGSFPDEAALVARISALGSDELVACFALVRDASAMVRAPWEGPWVRSAFAEAGGYHLSEDGTEGFTDWIVSQGRAYWAPACGADDALLQIYYEDYCRVREEIDHPRRWHGNASGKAHLSGIIYDVYTDQFGDDLYDMLEELYAG